MNKKVSIIITLSLIIAIGIIFISSGNTTDNTASVQNTEIKDGVQYITIDAQGGYSPQKSKAQAGIPTKLIVKTNGTYDCSLSLVIRSINYQKILPPTGEEIIDIGIPTAGVPFRGVCGMGMYNFEIEFS
ncbi:MAG: cupredoxin domain-containing protein [Candidatus Pacebacteria bacterium]|nr:cupredoxin domain-containing protein [Candidatus Paceibacterota bacterium]MCF7862572.1 cupredoxin domain-containing protein [Candidatus Paceibacterota bacterium]